MSRALALVDSSDESRKYESDVAANALLETKLYVPRSRTELVPRPRLVEALRHGAANKLTVVVAPAGFGKTTLLTGWLADTPDAAQSAAWVSLDAGDNEPALFWAYVISALQRVHPAAGKQALAQLRSPKPPQRGAILNTLINEISALDSDFTLILDDYHVIESDAIHGAMTFLLDLLPRRMRVVIASRADPPVALSRLRARGEVTELRVADLRFSLDEASAFLSRVMALDISASDTATLEKRTEGWIAGLKLAALSLKTRDDVHGFVESFSGHNRYIADYLVEEVLQSEGEAVRRFLLATSVLDRLNGKVCDAVTGGHDSQTMLEDLERRNLFIVALDDRREWFRYHHLFAEVLQKQAVAKDPGAAREAHRRASIWYELHGSIADAIRHALAAEDLERAAGFLERAWPEKDRSYESAGWLARVRTLPDEIVRRRPVLSMGYAWALLNSGELEAAEPRLQDVERWLEAIENGNKESEHSAAMVVDDDQRLATLRLELDSARVYLAQSLGDAATLERAKRALDLVPADDHAGRATGTALVALALWGCGDLEAAHRTFSDALAAMRAAGHELDAIRGIFVLGDIRVSQGRLREAEGIYEHGLEVAKNWRQSQPETDELYLGLSEVHREWNDLERAAGYLEAVRQAAPRAAHNGNRLRWCTSMARICEARGELDAAIELLDEAESYERRDPLPRLRPIPAIKARVHLAHGRIEDAIQWAKQEKRSIDDLSYLREFEHITLARILIAQSRNDDVTLGLLERLRLAAQTGGRMGSVIEILVLESIAHQALGNARRALDSLGEALTLAEPEGYVRVFLDEGTRMRDLLRHAVTRGLGGENARRMLSAFDAPKPKPLIPAPAPTEVAPGQSLTTRELEILRLIDAGLRNQEIADHLSISAATVKRHIANAYGKLGAGHRTEALVRAKELKLL